MKQFLLVFFIFFALGVSAQEIEDAYQHGLDLAAEKKYKEAIEQFNVFIAEIDKYPDAYYNRGYCYTQLGEWELAKKDLDTSLMLKADKPQPFYWRGMSNLELGNYDAAITDFNKVMEMLGGNEKSALAGRARAYLKKQDYFHALQDFEIAIKGLPDMPDLFLGRAYCNFYMKSYEKVMPDLEHYFETYPNTPDAMEMAMRTNFELKNYDKALYYAKEYARAPKVGYMGELFQGTIYVSLQKFDEGLGAFNRAIEKNPNYAEAYYSRGVCYSLMQNMDKACEDFHRAISLGYVSIKDKVATVCK